jgi:RsiW-degrading membrane proteinase PrsW (M82 family)
MSVQTIALAVSPAIALVWFFYARSSYRPQRKLLVAALFLFGGAGAGVALILNHVIEKHTQLWAGAPEVSHRLLYWTAGIGLNEEFAKLLVLLAVLFPRRDFQHPYQGLLGGATVAMGFAAIENLVYLERYGTATLLVRSLVTIPAHAFFTIPLGMALAYAKRAATLGAKYLWLVGGLAAAAMLHGLYDIWLSLPSGAMQYLAYAQVALMAVMTHGLMRLANASRPQAERA